MIADPNVDPSQLQVTSGGGDWFGQFGGQSVSFDPTQAAASSPMNGGGGVAGTATGMPTTGAPTSGAITMESFNQAWMNSPYPGTVDGLKQFYAAHPEYAAAGITLGGSKGDKVYGPGGAYWGDYVIGAGTPGGGTGKSAGSGPTAGGGGSSLAGLGYNFGDAMKPFGDKYALPTLDEFKASPFYGAGLDAYNRQLQNNPAARGTLLNGRVQEGIGKSLMDYGLTQYSTLAGLNSGVFDRNYDVWKDNRDSPFNKNLSLAQLGAPK